MSLVLVVQRARSIVGSSVGTVAELMQVVDLARTGKLKPIPIEKRPLSDVSRKLDELKAGTIMGGSSGDLSHLQQGRASDASGGLVESCDSVASRSYSSASCRLLSFAKPDDSFPHPNLPPQAEEGTCPLPCAPRGGGLGWGARPTVVSRGYVTLI